MSTSPMNIEPGGADGAGRDIVAPPAALSAGDKAALRRAVAELHRESLAMRLTSLMGRPMGFIGFMVPAAIADLVHKATELALRNAMGLALRSLADQSVQDRRGLHKSVVTMAGAAGGAFGLAGLPVELPFTTTVMLRSIADIARGEGEDSGGPRCRAGLP